MDKKEVIHRLLEEKFKNSAFFKRLNDKMFVAFNGVKYCIFSNAKIICRSKYRIYLANESMWIKEGKNHEVCFFKDNKKISRRNYFIHINKMRKNQL